MSDNSGATRCSGCLHGKHKQHEREYKNKQGLDCTCHCKVCNPERKPK